MLSRFSLASCHMVLCRADAGSLQLCLLGFLEACAKSCFLPAGRLPDAAPCKQVSRATLVPLLGRLQELPAVQLALQATSPLPAFPYKAAVSEADAGAKPGSAAAAAPGAAALAGAGLLVRAPCYRLWQPAF